MYKIVGMPGSRFTRVSWMLEELGQDYEIEKAMPQTPEAKAYNPSGKGPVLVDSHGDEDVVIIDSAAICFYLADRHSDEGMTAAPGTAERAAIDSWMHFAQNELEVPLWLKARHKFILPEELRLDVAGVCVFDFDRAVSVMESRLGANEFAIGDRFTPADILLGHTGSWAHNAKFEVKSDTVKAYFDRMLARPALASARKREKAV